MVKSFYDIVASDAVACYGLLNVTVVAGRDHIIYHRGIPLGSKLEQIIRGRCNPALSLDNMSTILSRAFKRTASHILAARNSTR